MSSDSELIAARAVGLSSLRLARAPLAFGLIAFLFMSLLLHVLIPASAVKRDALEAEIARNQAALLLTPGKFTEVSGLGTLYFSDFATSSVLRNVFLEDRRDPNAKLLHTAPQGRIARITDEDGHSQTVLILQNGTSQNLNAQTGRMMVAHYTQVQYGLDIDLGVQEDRPRTIEMISTPELLRASPELTEQLSAAPHQLRVAAHIRLSQTALGLLAAALGFMPLLLGSHNRLGHTPQIALGIIMVLIVMSSDSTGRSLARSAPDTWIFAYLAPALALVFVIGLAILLHPPRRSSTRSSSEAAC